MSFEDYSAIEDFRIQYHGECFLRLLKRADTGKRYELIAELTRGFFIGRDQATSESKLQDILTIDFRYSLTVDPAMVLKYVIGIDLVYPDDSFKRYSLGSNSPPSFSNNIFSQTLNANFNDRNEIIGVFVPDPDDVSGVGLSFANLLITGEIPAGDIDGSNATFTSEFDFIPESVEVFLNGLEQKRLVDFNTSGTQTISLTDSPGAGESIWINYIKG